MAAKIFEYVINIDPKAFLDWIHAELADLYPGVFISDPASETQQLTFTSGDTIEPSDNYPFYAYLIYAERMIFVPRETASEHTEKRKQGEPITVDMGEIASIEIRHIVNREHHIICFCDSSHPQIQQWLTDLGSRIEGIYRPLAPGSKKQKKESKRQDTTTIIKVDGNINGDVVIGNENQLINQKKRNKK